MRANPGGYIPPDQVVGRDQLVRRLWRVLERQSLVLTAERRIGKTSVLNKMKEEAPEGLVVFYRDIEGVCGPLEFVEVIYRDVEAHLSRRQRTANRVRRFVERMAGAEVASVIRFPETMRADWKLLLEHLMDDLVENQEGTVVFFWDEMPLMLYKLKTAENEAAAIEVLDALRAVRQRHPRVRMVFTGSIGLHYVLTALKRAGSANAPTNDMGSEEVSPLSPDDGARLARALFDGEQVRVVDPDTVSRAVSEEVDHFPYYIHHVVDEMTEDDAVWDAARVREIVDRRLRDGNDPWHLRHYRERIDTYYLGPERDFALAVLDILAAAVGPLSFDELFNLLRSRIATEDRETTHDVITLLRRDHYVEVDGAGAYRFRFPLLHRWWRLNRGI